MPAARYFSPVDTLKIKVGIQRKLGSVKSCKYFDLLKRYLGLKIPKSEFDRLCITTIGRENIPLHNHFIKAILKKACQPKTTLPKQSKVEGPLKEKTPNECNSLQLLYKNLPQSPRKCRTPSLRDRRFRDRPSPLGPHGKNNSIVFENSTPQIQEQQINTELHSLGNMLPMPVGNGEEIDQHYESMDIIRRSPIRPPLGIPTWDNRAHGLSHKGLSSGTKTDTCQSIGYLPDTNSLMKRLEHKLETEGCNISADAANVLNKALDVYLKRLIKPCLDLAASKSVNKFCGRIQPGMNEFPSNRCVQNLTGSASASISDFRTSMELNPTILGEDWPLHFERICFLASED